MNIGVNIGIFIRINENIKKYITKLLIKIVSSSLYAKRSSVTTTGGIEILKICTLVPNLAVIALQDNDNGRNLSHPSTLTIFLMVRKFFNTWLQIKLF